MSFSDDIKNFITKYEILSTSVFSKSCNRISMDIAEGSPVSTGTLLGSWSPSLNGDSPYSFKGGMSAWRGGRKDASVESTNRASAMSNLAPRINSTTSSLSKTDSYYFTNNTEYIAQAEYTGWQEVGAYHMRENAILNWQLIVNNSVTDG